MVVEIARDWLDYVEAGGILLSLLLAGGALIYAKRSADAASGSAAAAETTAAAATEEAQQTRELVRLAADQHDRLVRDASRRPKLAVPTLEAIDDLRPDKMTMGEHKALLLSGADPEELTLVVIRATFENTGDRVATQTRARLVVHPSVRLWLSGPTGDHRQQVDLVHDDLALIGPSGEAGSHAHAWRIHHLPPNQPEILHAVLAFPEPGMYEAELQVAHEDTEEVAQRFAVDVSEDGRATVRTR